MTYCALVWLLSRFQFKVTKYQRLRAIQGIADGRTVDNNFPCRAHWSVLRTCWTSGRASAGSVLLVETYLRCWYRSTVVQSWGSTLPYLDISTFGAEMREEKGPTLATFILCSGNKLDTYKSSRVFASTSKSYWNKGLGWRSPQSSLEDVLYTCLQKRVDFQTNIGSRVSQGWSVVDLKQIYEKCCKQRQRILRYKSWEFKRKASKKDRRWKHLKRVEETSSVDLKKKVH